MDKETIELVEDVRQLQLVDFGKQLHLPLLKRNFVKLTSQIIWEPNLTTMN